jgi:CDP-diacylglycerol--glycerol-3-phosphate 3-phosphatidyltransferase
LPLIFIPIGFARYAFVFGLWIRKQLNRVNHDLPPSSTRRPIAGFTMAFMSVMLWPIVTYPGTLIAGVIFLIPFSVSFLRDWLVVSGVFDASNATYQRWRSDLREIIFEWIPIGVRLFLVVVLLWTVIAGLGSGNQAAEISNATNAFYLFLVMVGLAIPLIILGVAGRIVAFALLIPVSITIILQGIDIQLAFLLVGVLLSLILGSGKFSLWRPSDGFLFSVERS